MRKRNEALVRRAQETAVERNRERLLELFRASVPERYLCFDIDDYLPDDDEDSIISDGAQISLSSVVDEEPTFTIIRGQQGTGKTTLAVTLLDHWMSTFDIDIAPDDAPLNARMLTFAKLLTELSFNRDILDDLASTYILAIDDIGAGSDAMSDHQLRYLTDLIEDRWSRDLPTIITTNMPITAQRDSRGLSDLFAPQSWDRIQDSYVLVSLEGESHRGAY